MTRLIRLAACLLALFSTVGAWAQTPDAETNATSPETTSAPVAHVYVNSGAKILAYSAASNGKLTAVPGSPFNFNISWMRGNGPALFGFEPSSILIDSLSIASNGALKKVATTNPENYWPLGSGCPLAAWAGQEIIIDSSGKSLYNAGQPDDGFCQMNFQSYNIDTNGELTYLGETGPIFDGGNEVDVLGNGKYAYAPECTDFDAPGPHGAQDNNFHAFLVPFQRLSNGELVGSNATYSFPTAPNDSSDPTQPSPGFYCPRTAVTDSTNHMAMVLSAVDENLAEFYGPSVIAIYTADTHGNLTTASSYKTLTTPETGGGAMSFSPSGKFFAVGGAGLEIFHFTGANPMTKYKTILTGNGIGQIFWDNDNHLYALGSNSKGAGMLWVYTVTSTSVTEASGSPYSIANEGSLYVQPL